MPAAPVVTSIASHHAARPMVGACAVMHCPSSARA